MCRYHEFCGISSWSQLEVFGCRSHYCCCTLLESGMMSFVNNVRLVTIFFLSIFDLAWKIHWNYKITMNSNRFSFKLNSSRVLRINYKNKISKKLWKTSNGMLIKTPQTKEITPMSYVLLHQLNCIVIERHSIKLTNRSQEFYVCCYPGRRFCCYFMVTMDHLHLILVESKWKQYSYKRYENTPSKYLRVIQ